MSENREPQLNPLDFLNPRSIDAARELFRRGAAIGRIDGELCGVVEIARVIDTHTDRFPDAADQWVPWSGVREQEYWWWWNQDEDSAPVPVYIMLGSDGKFFATEGQHGWNRFQFVEEMGGLWRKMIEPPVPHSVA